MTPAFGLKVPWDCTPCCTEKCRGGNGGGKNQSKRKIFQPETDQSYSEPADVGLSFRANVEEAAVKSNGKGQGCKNEIGCVVKSVANALIVAERPVKHDLQGNPGRCSDGPDDKS